MRQYTKKFSLQLLIQSKQTGNSSSILFINGFLQQHDEAFEDWLSEQAKLSQSHSVYGVNWASQSFEDFQRLIEEAMIK